MFVDYEDRPADRRRGAGPARRWSREPLALLAERTRPVSSSQARLLPVLPPLVDLFPDGGLRRGSTIALSGPDGTARGSMSLALALVAAASEAGSWCALVGVTGFGAVAAHDIGIDLTRLAVIPQPGAAWPEVVAALAGGVDLLVLQPPFPPRPSMATRVVARVRERRSVLVVMAGGSRWPEPPDIHLSIDGLRWDGAGTGEGYLRRRRASVTATGRRAAARPRHGRLWMPSPTGTVLGMAADATPDGAAGVGAVSPDGAVGVGAVSPDGAAGVGAVSPDGAAGVGAEVTA